jgi:cyclophilin family peptidyl-prolyl cis-trans isomerase
VIFIITMIASMAAVGLGVGSSSSNNEGAPIIDQTGSPTATPRVPQFAAPQPVIDATQPHTAVLRTNKGEIRVQLATDAPQAVNSFAFLAAKNFYNGTALYYVNQDYLAQGGDPNCAPESEQVCTGFGDPGYSLPLEATSSVHERWTVAAPAISQPDRVHGSQFRIYFGPDSRVDGKETIFGKVITGTEILEALPNLEICSALNQPTDTCVDGFEEALIIEDIVIE